MENLRPNTGYVLRMKEILEGGRESEWTEVELTTGKRVVTTTTSEVVPRPGHVRVLDTTDHSVRVTWDLAGEDEGEVTRFVVTYWPDDSPETERVRSYCFYCVCDYLSR